MRYEDERYVRLYTRDTAEDIALGWEARALWHELLKKFDRAGILELGRTGIRGIAGLTGIPVEVVERALPLLLEDGRIVMRGTRIVYPDYIAANETPSSSTLRSKEWRARRREVAAAEALLDGSQRSVPIGDVSSPNGTRGDANERAGTRGDSVLIRADPIRTDPDQRDPGSAGPGQSPGSSSAGPVDVPFDALDFSLQPPEPAKKPRARRPALPANPGAEERVFAAYLEGWHRVVAGTRPPSLDDTRRGLIRARLKTFTVEDLESAVRGLWNDEWHVANRRIGFDLAVRTAKAVEFFRDLAANQALGKKANGRSTGQQPAPAGVETWEKAGIV